MAEGSIDSLPSHPGWGIVRGAETSSAVDSTQEAIRILTQVNKAVAQRFAEDMHGKNIPDGTHPLEVICVWMRDKSEHGITRESSFGTGTGKKKKMVERVGNISMQPVIPPLTLHIISFTPRGFTLIHHLLQDHDRQGYIFYATSSNGEIISGITGIVESKSRVWETIHDGNLDESEILPYLLDHTEGEVHKISLQMVRPAGGPNGAPPGGRQHPSSSEQPVDNELKVA